VRVRGSLRRREPRPPQKLAILVAGPTWAVLAERENRKGLIMRVALLSWESLHSIAVGGLGVHVTELAAALARGGHHIHVFTRRALGQPAHDVKDEVHYHRCNYPGQDDFVDDVNAMCRAFVDRVFEVEDLVGPFDIIHAHDWLLRRARSYRPPTRSSPRTACPMRRRP
jgi:glycogen synthase